MYNKTNLMYLSVFLIVISELYVFYIVIQLSILRMNKKNKNKIPQVVEVIMKASFIQWMQQRTIKLRSVKAPCVTSYEFSKNILYILTSRNRRILLQNVFMPKYRSVIMSSCFSLIIRNMLSLQRNSRDSMCIKIINISRITLLLLF